MSASPRVFVTRRLPPAVTRRLTETYDTVLNEDDRLLSASEIAAGAEGCHAILCCGTDRFDRALVEALPACVAILATFSVGHEHIDLEAARSRGLQVTNTPDVLNDATADIAMLLLLAAARRAHEGARLLREDRWATWTTTLLCGVHVSGKRLGIYGMGRIGQAVARRARGFDMTVHYHNRSRLPEELEQGAIYHADAEEMLPHCDFLSLNAPSSPQTRKFLDSRRIALLPDGAVVVNTARGTLVDDDALIAALRAGKHSAAGLDVFEGEPRIDPRYREIENAFLLPHVGSATTETRDAMGFRCLDNFDAFFAGRTPPDALM